MAVLDHSRPFYKVDFYGPDSSELKSAFSPNIFLDTEKPSENNLVSSDIYISHLTVTSKLDASVNSCDLEVRHGIGGEMPIEVGYKAKIYFGFYDQDKSQGPEFSIVYTGFVTEIKNGLEKSIINCKSSMKKITKKKTKITFARMMGLNEIIKKFAIELGGLELAQNGIYDPQINKQPGFGVSEQQPIIDHVKKIAKYGGLDVFLDVFDKFHAIPWDTSKLKDAPASETSWVSARESIESDNSDFYKHKIEFDRNLVDINFEQSAEKYSGVEVVSYIPFSEKQAHTIDPVKVVYPSTGSDTTGKPLDRHKLSHITREDAEKIAENIHRFNTGKIRGGIKLLGAPQIRIGDGIKFSGPDLEQLPFSNIKFDAKGSTHSISDILFQVTEVQHKFDTVEGYITKLNLLDKPASVGGPSGAGAAGGAGTAAGAGITAEGVEFTGEAGTVASGIPIQITNVQWDKEEARQGDLITLTADVEGASDGTQGEIEIYEHDVDGIHDSIAKFPVDVNNNKIKTTWEYEYHEDTDEIPTDEELQKQGLQYNPPEYFFVVNIGDADGQSGILKFKDYVEIYLKDVDGEPMANEEYILQLPDNSEIKGNLDSEGYAKVEGIPPGKITVKFPNL